MSSVLLAIILVVTYFALTQAPDFYLTCFPNSVETTEGRDAILSCQHGGDLSRESVEWRLEWNHHGPNQKTVHVTRNGAEDTHSRADPQYQNRTDLDQNQMTEGRVSLTIFNVSEEDAGNYSCLLHVYQTGDEKMYTGKGYVNLVVKIKNKDMKMDISGVAGTTTDKNLNEYAVIAGAVAGAVAGLVIVVLLAIISGIVVLVLWIKGLLPHTTGNRRVEQELNNDSEPRELQRLNDNNAVQEEQ